MGNKMELQNGKKINILKSFDKVENILSLSREEKIERYIKTYPYLKKYKSQIFETTDEGSIASLLSSSKFKYLGFYNGIITVADINKDKNIILNKISGGKVGQLGVLNIKKNELKLLKIIEYGINNCNRKLNEDKKAMSINGFINFLKNKNIEKKIILNSVYLTHKNVDLNILTQIKGVLSKEDFMLIKKFSKEALNLNKLLFLIKEEGGCILNEDIPIFLNSDYKNKEESIKFFKEILFYLINLSHIEYVNKKRWLIKSYYKLTAEDIIFLKNKNIFLNKEDIKKIEDSLEFRLNKSNLLLQNTIEAEQEKLVLLKKIEEANLLNQMLYKKNEIQSVKKI